MPIQAFKLQIALAIRSYSPKNSCFSIGNPSAFLVLATALAFVPVLLLVIVFVQILCPNPSPVSGNICIGYQLQLGNVGVHRNYSRRRMK